ncbi:MAG: hypothetical protein JWR67_3139, partial [Mucilaginibacter sp.]|nr:hypothetical protein [Mucilaginibacter sp.]
TMFKFPLKKVHIALYHFPLQGKEDQRYQA